MSTDGRIVNFHEVKGDARAGAVYIGRATRAGHSESPFHNPFTGENAIPRFRSYFLNRVAIDGRFREQVMSLKGRTLGCWCGVSCHGQVILDWLDRQS